MGRTKELMHDAMQMGYSARDQFVCGDCLNDPALAEFVLSHASETRCNYCSKVRTAPFAVELSEVIEHMAECIGEEYTDPANELPYETAEGGWQGEVLDAWELLEEVGFAVDSEELWDDVVGAFCDQQWCRKNYFALTPSERLQYGWREFKAVVQHSRRFTFWSMGDPSGESEHHPDYMPVGRMLVEIGQCIHDARLVKSVPIGTPIWRVRIHGADIVLSTAQELGPPPLDKAVQSNRMSPAGVVMFYGSEDFETACAETIDPNQTTNAHVTGVTFQTVRELRLLDLVDVPHVPSIFDSGKSELRHTLRFLNHFARDLAIPVSRNGREHVDYVSTQAFTEYVRYEIGLKEGTGIDGIRYRSAVTGRPCVVLFCTEDQCIRQSAVTMRTEQWLDMAPDSLRTESVDDITRHLASRGHARARSEAIP